MFQVRIFFFSFVTLNALFTAKELMGAPPQMHSRLLLFIDRRGYFHPAVSALDLVTGAKLH